MLCLFNEIFSRKLLWRHRKQRTTLHMFGSCRSNSSCLTNQWPWFRSSHQRCSIKKSVLKKFTKFIGKHLCQILFFNKVVGLSSIFKNTFFTEHLRATASVDCPKQWVYIAMGCSFITICYVLHCQWYFRNVCYLLVYLQASNLG